MPDLDLPIYRDLFHLTNELYWCYDDAENLLLEPARRETHDEYPISIWIVKQGKAEVSYEDGKWFAALAGQCGFIRAGLRRQRFTPDTQLISIAFDARWFDGTHLFSKGLPVAIDLDKCQPLATEFMTLCQVVRTVLKNDWDLRRQQIPIDGFFEIQSHFHRYLKVLISCLKQVGVEPQMCMQADHRVQKAAQIVKNNLPGPPLTVDDVSRRVGISHAQLSRLFQESYGMTISRFQRKVRMDYAQKYLRQQDVQISDIAVDLGFSHLAAFSNWFRRQSGQSPRDYRKQILKTHYRV